MAEGGICAIKPEFVITNHIREVTLNCVSDKDKLSLEKKPDEQKQQQSTENVEEPPNKKQRLSKKEKKKLRGQNKGRPAPFKIDRDQQLCNSLVDIAENEEPKKCNNEKCKFLHNVKEYFALKPKDIGEECINYKLNGRCARGITCRFGSCHITPEGFNKINKEVYDKYKQENKPSFINHLSYDLLVKLRKRKYDFSLAENTVKSNDKRRDLVRMEKAKNENEKVSSEEKENTKNVSDQNSETNETTLSKQVEVNDSVNNENGEANENKSESAKLEDNKDLDKCKELKINDNVNYENGEANENKSESAKLEDNKDLDKCEERKVNDSVKNENGDENESKSESAKLEDNKDLDKCEEQKLIGAITDEDLIKIRKSEKKTIDWRGKLYLSPLTTVGNLPFRRICKEYGADITCGEMAVCTALLQGLGQEWALVKRHPSEDIFGVQICGNNPHTITKTAQLLQENTEIDFIDLNLGCPIDLIYREGSGSGMLRRPHILESVVRCASNVLNIPFTVKTRVGVYSNQNIAHTFVPKFKEWGASMITVHGRSREQRYTRSADWPYIEQCAALADPVPLFGNGDILSYEDYLFAKENYKSVSGFMIGRGALIKPWLFTEIKEQKLWDISSSERFDIIKKYTNYGLEHWGSDTKGVENTRRFLLEWLSFLYRYVPVGVLEKPPQKINERPPSYIGRNDLETLMASGSCTDWIKISEMLLGPVPQDFRFLPKHKANSYK